MMHNIPLRSWIVQDQVLACIYPQDEQTLAAFAAEGVTLLINLHERGHGEARLGPHGITELHLPVADFTPPSTEQLEQGVAAIDAALASGGKVAVHCAAGLGRTGTLLACWLVSRGDDPDTAIRTIRAARPGSVETAEQVRTVHRFAETRRMAGSGGQP